MKLIFLTDPRTMKSRWNLRSFVYISIAIIIIVTLVEAKDSGDSDKKEKKGGKNGLCLDPSVIQKAAESDGIDGKDNPEGFAPSKKSKNNFINFCAGKEITNGRQVEEGSCVPTPIGQLPAKTKMTSVKIISPKPKTKLEAKVDFQIEIAVRNIEVGFFTPPKTTYYLSPQQLNGDGLIKGHVHVVIQATDESDTPLDAQNFAFFKGIATRAKNGKIKAAVTGGLPDGNYRICTITSSMNHQPVVMPVAQRGAADDCSLIKVGTGKTSEKEEENHNNGSGNTNETGGSQNNAESGKFSEKDNVNKNEGVVRTTGTGGGDNGGTNGGETSTKKKGGLHGKCKREKRESTRKKCGKSKGKRRMRKRSLMPPIPQV